MRATRRGVVRFAVRRRNVLLAAWPLAGCMAAGGGPRRETPPNPYVSSRTRAPGTAVDSVLVIAPSWVEFRSDAGTPGSATLSREVSAYASTLMAHVPRAFAKHFFIKPPTGAVVLVDPRKGPATVPARPDAFVLRIQPFRIRTDRYGTRLELELQLQERATQQEIWHAIVEVDPYERRSPEQAADGLAEQTLRRLRTDAVL